MLSLLSRCANSAFAPRPVYTALRIHAGIVIPVNQKSAIPAIPGRDFCLQFNECKVYYVGGQRGTGALNFLCIVFFMICILFLTCLVHTAKERLPS